jgi:multimeric flavodoxin WrbA
MDIRPCDGCFTCLEEGESCVIEDDMVSLSPKLLRADAIVFASPVYWYNISAQLKLCIDRFVAFEIKGGNELQGKQIGIVLSYGDTDIYTSGGVNAIHAFQSMFRYLKGDIVGMVYGTGNKPGEIAENTELMERAYKLGLKLGESNAK